MASDETWEKLRYFRKDSKVDNWGDPEIISDEHLLRLDDFRHWIGVPIYVLHGVKTTGHEPNSYHYPREIEGKLVSFATDIIIPDFDESSVDLILATTRFGFTGIGYYPHWRWNGKVVGGLHVDSRPLKWDSDFTINYGHSRWMGVLIDGKQTYIELNFENLINYTVEIEEKDISGMH